MSLLSGVRTVIIETIKMTHLFHLYQMQKIKELLKAHSIFPFLSIVSTFKPLKTTFNEVALLAELSTVTKFVCTSFRSVVSETAETTWQPILIRAFQVCCSSPANRLSGHTLPHTNTETVLGHVCSGVIFEGLLSLCAVKLFLQTV